MRRVVSVLVLLAIVIAIPLVRQYKQAHAPVAETRDVDEGTVADRAAKRAAVARDLAGLTPTKTTSHGVDVGGFEATFTTRSPLSAPATLTQRLRLLAPPDAYDLATIGFFVYVPVTYDPARPMGLIVLANYKPTARLPMSIFAQLDAANVAFVVAKPLAQPWTTRAGLLLDAACNMSSRYRIDPRRVYMIASNEPKDPDGTSRFTGEQVGLSFPEVFRGTVAVNFAMYRPVRAANGGNWIARLPQIDLDALAQAKQRPIVLATMDKGEASDRIAAAFTADGFQHVLYRTLTVEQFHYPNYTTDWLPATLKFFDDVTTATTTQP